MAQNRRFRSSGQMHETGAVYFLTSHHPIHSFGPPPSGRAPKSSLHTEVTLQPAHYPGHWWAFTEATGGHLLRPCCVPGIAAMRAGEKLEAGSGTNPGGTSVCLHFADEKTEAWGG